MAKGTCGTLLRDGTKLHSENIYPRAFSIAFSPDGSLLATGNKNGTMHLWDTRTGAYLKTLTGDDQTSWVYSVAFSPDSTILASGTRTGVQLWDVVTGQPTTTFAGSNVTSIAFSPAGDLLASGGSDIWLWGVAHGADRSYAHRAYGGCQQCCVQSGWGHPRKWEPRRYSAPVGFASIEDVNKAGVANLLDLLRRYVGGASCLLLV